MDKKERPMKIQRYICLMPLTATSITDDTPLPDPDNPFQIFPLPLEEENDGSDNDTND